MVVSAFVDDFTRKGCCVQHLTCDFENLHGSRPQSYGLAFGRTRYIQLGRL
jgi:hypothetical protein